MHRILCAVACMLVCGGLVPASGAQQLQSHGIHPKKIVPDSNGSCSSLPSRWQRHECYDFHHSAPGDQYFGRLKISYLGIDNTAHDVAIEAGAYTVDPRLISKLMFADEALHQWEHEYPGDPQLARSYFLMIGALRKVYTQSAQNLAWAYMQHVIHVYPASYFAKVLRRDVAIGFTEHWFAVAQICPTPLPTQSPGRGRREEPTPSPTPVPTPVLTPTPTPRGQPNVDVITPPCVQPQTPAPEASESPESPEMTPSPQASPT